MEIDSTFLFHDTDERVRKGALFETRVIHPQHDRLGREVRLTLALKVFRAVARLKCKQTIVRVLVHSTLNQMLPHFKEKFELFILNSVRIPLGLLVGLNRRSSADGSNGRASRWQECLMAAFASVINLLTHACDVL